MKSQKKTITLVRHGETEANKEGRFIGITDVGLNSVGREQAHVSGRFLLKQNWKFDQILHSPLKRCEQTAEIIHSYLPTSIMSSPLLVERNYGIFENRMKTELKQQYPELYSEYTAHKPHVILPEGESALNVENRIRSLLWDVLPSKFPNAQNFLFVTHLNPIRALLHILSLADWDIYDRTFHNTSVTQLQTDLETSDLILFDYSCYADTVCND